MSDTAIIALIAAGLVAVLVALLLGKRLKLRRGGVDVGGDSTQTVTAKDESEIGETEQRGTGGKQVIATSGRGKIGKAVQDSSVAAGKGDGNAGDGGPLA